MKKLFITAIALVAFSGVSMASTIEVKNSEIPEMSIESNISTDENVFFQDVRQCDGVYSQILLDARQHGIEKSIAECIAFAGYLTCIGYDNTSHSVKIHNC